MPRAYGITNAAPYASAPAVGVAGDTYWNTATKVLYVSDGTAWNPVGPGGPPSGAAGGDLLGSTYPNPVVAAATVTATKLAAGATLVTPAPRADPAGVTSIATTELLLCELTITVLANRPLVVVGSVDGWQQSEVAAATDSQQTMSLRRGGTSGQTNGTVVGPQNIAAFTTTGQFQRMPFHTLLIDVYVPPAGGTVRYSVTILGNQPTTTINAAASGHLVGLLFS